MCGGDELYNCGRLLKWHNPAMRHYVLDLIGTATALINVRWCEVPLRSARNQLIRADLVCTLDHLVRRPLLFPIAAAELLGMSDNSVRKYRAIIERSYPYV